LSKNPNPFLFIGILTITSSLLLSLAATQLKSYQDYNVDVDKKKNVLKCIGLDVSVLSSEKIINEYNSRIYEIITDKDGNSIETVSFSDLTLKENKMTGESMFVFEGKNYLPIFIIFNFFTNKIILEPIFIYFTAQSWGFTMLIKGNALYRIKIIIQSKISKQG